MKLVVLYQYYLRDIIDILLLLILLHEKLGSQYVILHKQVAEYS